MQSSLSRSTAFICISALILFLLTSLPANAHHPFAMGDSTDLNAFQGLLSGIGHPLLGPDHFLFMSAILFVGISKPKSWVLPMVVLGLIGSGISQIIPIPSDLETFGEVLLSLSLVVEGFVALNLIPNWILFPCITIHGYLLGAAITGAEPTPLIAYLAGLAIAQGSMLYLVSITSDKFLRAVGSSKKNILAGIWIGIGFAFTWSLVIP